jgi:hypothetical protein
MIALALRQVYAETRKTGAPFRRLNPSFIRLLSEADSLPYF